MRVACGDWTGGPCWCRAGAAAAASDIGYAAYPGTEGAFLAMIDTFVAARNAKGGRDASEFLSIVGSAAREPAFARVKGSAPLRKDTDPSSLPAYPQSACQAMNAGPVLLSITRGGLLGPQFQQAVAGTVRMGC